MTTDHYLERDAYPGSGGDRPTPWEVTYTCGGCGAELWTAEEGRGTTVGTPDEALEEHLAELTGPTCDECDERDGLTTWGNLRAPVTLCASCEHDARRSGWAPGAAA